MPIYEYRCADCGNKSEAMQKISDAPLTVCPKCEGKLEKQISLSGFQFKGSGWYISDYTNRGKEASAESKSGDATAKTGDATAKTDAVKIDAATTDAAKTVSSGESTASAASASKSESPSAKTE